MPGKVVEESAVQGMKIACPPGWIDRSMLILNAGQPGPSGVAPNLVVTREPIPDDLPEDRVARLEAFVDRQLEQMHAALAGLDEIDRQTATASQWSAEVRIDWVSGETPLSQWITYADAGDETFIVATATTGRGDFAAVKATFQAMLQTVRLT